MTCGSTGADFAARALIGSPAGAEVAATGAGVAADSSENSDSQSPERSMASSPTGGAACTSNSLLACPGAAGVAACGWKKSPDAAADFGEAAAAATLTDGVAGAGAAMEAAATEAAATGWSAS